MAKSVIVGELVEIGSFAGQVEARIEHTYGSFSHPTRIVLTKEAAKALAPLLYQRVRITIESMEDGNE